MIGITDVQRWFRSGMRQAGGRVIFSLLLLFSFGLAVGAPVDGDKARLFAERWLDAVDQPLGADFSAQSSIASVAAINNSAGELIAYNVTLSPAGYVIISADDRIQPVITFSGSGSFDNLPANPLTALLQIDIGARLAAVSELAPEGPATRGADPVEHLQQCRRINQHGNVSRDQPPARRPPM